MSKRGIIITSIVVAAVGGGTAYGCYQSEQQWNRACDGVQITSNCTADEGVRYAKYIYHAGEPERTEYIEHPAEPAKTHTVHHDAVWGTRKVMTGCIETNISYKKGTCALSRCRDGKYSGSTGWGTCNYHGGVWYGGGPWYTYREERYIVTPAWDEVITDVPAKEAWSEPYVIPAVEEYYEKVKA